MVLFCVQWCVCRKCLSSPSCRSELIDSTWVVIVPGQKYINKNIYFLLLKRGFFYSQSNLWIDDRISTIAIGFLKHLSCYFEEFRLYYSLRLLFQLHKNNMKVRNNLYLQYLDYNDRYQKGYQENYDAFGDFVKDLDSLSIKTDIEVLRDHVFQKYFWS